MRTSICTPDSPWKAFRTRPSKTPLLAATSQYQGRQLVGVIDSLGQRKVVKAVAVLNGLLNKENAVATAAAGALGRIGTPESAAILTGRPGEELAGQDGRG